MSLPTGFNWFLIFCTIVVFFVVIAAVIYIIVEYQHPEDRNQAYFPKLVVLCSLSLAVYTILLFPLDVANVQACSSSISPSSCTYTLPMETLWYICFISNLVLTFAVIPFTLFFYEADSDFNLKQKIKYATIWTLGAAVVLGFLLGVLYGLFGYVIYPTQQLTSGLIDIRYLIDFNETSTLLNSTCIKPLIVGYNTKLVADGQCNGFGSTYKSSTWKLRVSFCVYVMAMQSIFGWLLFLLFAGVGVFAAPISWIYEFVGRPKSVISKSDFIRRARLLATRAREVREMGELLRKQQRDGKWRSTFKRLQILLVQIEDDDFSLERVYPQGENGETLWILYQLGFYVTGFMGVCGICLSLAWIAQIGVYMLPPNPPSPMLNQAFVDLDNVWSLLGVAAFGSFCLYLMVVAMKGNFMLGTRIMIINLYPMKPSGTMMSSFLFNSALVLAMSCAVLQFCAQAFGAYASGTSIFDVFGNQVMYLEGIRYIYNFNVFLYVFLAVTLLGGIYMAITGPTLYVRKKKVENIYAV